MASGTEVGKAYVQIMPSAEGLSGSISDLMSGEASKAGASAGGSFSGAFAGALKGTGAVLAGTAVAIGGVTAALVEGVSSTAEYADSVDKASQKLGISSTAYQQWDAVLQHSGTSMESMSATFKTLANASQSSSDKQVEAFEAIGLSMKDVKSMSTEDLFGAVISGLQDMEEGTERTSLATTLLGRGAMEMGALLNTSSEDTQAMIDRVTELGGVLDEDAIKNGAAFTDSLQDMNTALEGLKNGAMAELLPSFTTVIDGLTDIFSGNESGIGKVAGGIQMIANEILEQLPTILETGSQIVQSLVTAILDNLPTIATTAMTIITELALYLIDNLDQMTEVTFQIIESLIDGLQTSLPKLLAKFIEIIPKLVTTITTKFPEILKLGINLLMELINGIVAALPDLIKQAPEIINSFVSALLEMLDVIIDCGIQLISALTGPEALPKIIDAIVAVAPDIITSLLEALIELYPLIISAGLDLFMCLLENMPDIYIKVGEAIFELIDKLIDKLVEKWPDMKQAGLEALSQLFEKMSDVIKLAQDKAKEIVDTIVEKIKGMASDIKDVGKWIVEGIWDGISGSADWLNDKLGEFADGVVNGVKDFFDIHSPSKRMADQVGKFLPEGMAVGITANTDAVTNAMDELGNTTIDVARNSLNANYGSLSSAEVSGDNSVYRLLATYLPELVNSNKEVNVNVTADTDRLFNVMQKKAKQYSRSTGLHAFS